jgi:hypothetical protein
VKVDLGCSISVMARRDLKSSILVGPTRIQGRNGKRDVNCYASGEI